MDNSPPEQEFENISHNLNVIRENVKIAIENRANRLKEDSPPVTRLVAVSKTKSIQHILAAYNSGQRHFGENYVQELISKAQDLGKDYPDIKWHFIGHLQSNKVSKLLGIGKSLFVVETIDSKHLAQIVNSHQAKRIEVNPQENEPLRVMIQVNTSGEDAKSGVSPDECKDLVEFVIKECPALKFLGLMTIGADYDHLAGPNPDFLLLERLRASICESLGLSTKEVELSMGMSSNYAEAVELGSTNIRVGSTIFGPRIYKTA